MLKFRVIPTILVDGPNVVKGTGFDNWRRIGTLAPILNVFNARDVDELMLIDSGATRSGREFDLRILTQAVTRVSSPLTVGGGILTMPTLARLIEEGADRVVLGSVLSEDPGLLERSASRFGSQALVAAIDVRKTVNGYMCYSRGGTRALNDDPVALARRYEAAGAGEIIVTSIDRDGEMIGFDLDITGEVADSVSIPVVAAGGASSPADFATLASHTGVVAATASSLFMFTEATPLHVREALAAQGVPVRRTRPSIR